MPTTYIDVGVSGLNDIFSTLAHYINYYKEQKWNLNDIYFSSKIYINLLNYVDVNCINFVLPTNLSFNKVDLENEKKNLKNKYDVLHFHERPIMLKTNLNVNTDYHLSNFIKIKDYILKQSLAYASQTSVHLRFMSNERNRNLIDNDISYYKNKILNLINHTDNQYTIVSSQEFEWLIEISNKFKNIKHLPKNYKAYRNRQQNVEEAFVDLAILSQSEFIYKTEGLFTSAAQMFGKGIPQIYNL